MTPEEQAVRAYWKAKNASIAIDGAHYEHSDSFSRFANDAMRFVNDAICNATQEEREACAKMVDHWSFAQGDLDILAAAIRSRSPQGAGK